MIVPLSGLLAAIGLAGATGFLFHLRRIVDTLPVPVSLACAGLGVLTAMVAVGLGRQATIGLLRQRSTVSVLVLCAAGALFASVVGALLQVGVSLVLAHSMQVDQSEYERMGVASTRLLTPAFIVVFHGVVCSSLAYAGLRRHSQSILLGGLLLSLPTLYFLVKYANAPL